MEVLNPATLIASNQALGIRIDWLSKLRRVWDLKGHGWDEALLTALATFQSQTLPALEPRGYMCAATRKALENQYPELAESLLGPHVGPRTWITPETTQEEIYDFARRTIEDAQGMFWDIPYQPQLLALRGARWEHDALTRRDSDLQKAQATLASGAESAYFGGADTGFDDALLLVWREGAQKRALIYRATVSPNALWASGTSHLRDGQYLYRWGAHRTSEPRHREAILAFDPAPYGIADLVRDSDERTVQYVALNAASEIEVIRSEPGYIGLTQADYQRSRACIAERDPRYVSAWDIRINIHSSPHDAPSSQGCQNIPLPYYAAFLAALRGICAKHPLGHHTIIPYTLIDASKIA